MSRHDAPDDDRPDAFDDLAAIADDEATALGRLLQLARRLRGPDGCPWDRKQSLQSMKGHVLAEAYEVADAIDGDRTEEIREELGDLAFLIVFCAEIGRDTGRFAVPEVFDGHVRKMIERHPHVFGDASAETADEVVRQWEANKQRRRAADGDAGSVLDAGVPGLPALTAALRVQRQANAVGFDWPDVSPVLDKVEEEIGELRTELGSDRNDARHAAELGDLLFALVNLARFLDVDPEVALRGATARFIQRFRYVEAELARDHRTPRESTLEEMDRLWDAAKARGIGDA